MAFPTFQKSVNTNPAPGIEGDFASANPRASMIAGEGALVAGPDGVVLGRFGFANNANGVVTSAAPAVTTFRTGFAARAQPALLTGWLEGAGMTLQGGLEVTLHVKGDFWARFAGGAVMGQSVFASYADGSALSAVKATGPTGAAFTGVIAVTTGILTASAVTGAIVVGAPISGGTTPAGTIVTAQLTGTPGGAGTYQTNIITAVASAPLTTPGGADTGFTVQSTAAAGELAKISA